METKNVLEDEFRCLLSRGKLGKGHKVSHFAEPVNITQDGVVALRGWKA